MKKKFNFNKTVILNLFQNLNINSLLLKEKAKNQYEFTNIRFSDEVKIEQKITSPQPSPSREGVRVFSQPTFQKKVAFTLAEVLITLTILGVVAAITVPSLQKMNYKRTQISRMAKAYSSLEKAATNIAENTNCIGKGLECTGLLNLSGDEFATQFVKLSNFRTKKSDNNQMVAIRGLGSNSKPTQYFIDFLSTPDNIAYIITKTTLLVNKSDPKNIWSYVYGTGIRIDVITDKNLLYNNNKIISWSATNKASDAIDGRNVFHFVIWDNFKVDPLIITSGAYNVPLSCFETVKGMAHVSESLSATCDPNNNTVSWNGGSCTARIIRDGWKMNY